MSDKKNVDEPSEKDKSEISDINLALPPSDVSSVAGSVTTAKGHSRVSSSSERQIKFERAQKCLENAALVSKRIKEHRKATAELLGRPFEDDDAGDTASEMASAISERTGYSVATDTSTTLSLQDALNIPGISESLANTLKQKEILMERIKHYKEISKKPVRIAPSTKKDVVADAKVDLKKNIESISTAQLVNTIKEKDNALSVIQVKMKAMENTILDLQEKITEKDQIIEAKNRATSLMSDSLSKKEKDSMALLEDTRQQMIKMQENFVNMEVEWRDEKDKLYNQIKEKDEKIISLEEANTILENSRFEISLESSKLLEELNLKNKEILSLEEKISAMRLEAELTEKEKEDVEEEKGSREISDMVELTKKIELLEQLNCQIRQTNKELENKLANINSDQKSTPSGSPSKKGSPLPTRKGGRNTSSKAKSPWTHLATESTQDAEKKSNKNELSKLEIVVQSLNKDILEKEYLISQRDSIISELKTKITENELVINELKLQSKPQVNVTDVAVCTDSSNSFQPMQSDIELIKYSGLAEQSAVADLSSSQDTKELQEKLQNACEQITALNNEIDSANKNMIKVKSNHKIKLKQMQKTIDNFSKVSDANAEIVKLNEELHQLSQKVAELEEEKGNLQLHLVDYDSGRLTDSEVYKKMVEMENLAETRLKSISLLETQKFDLVQELHELQQKNMEMEDKLADMSQLQNDQVTTEIKSVQLEEQVDQLSASKKELKLIIENLKLDKEQLEKSIKVLEEEKEELIHKLENYIQENMDLTDKLEKLSAEKVSSAESIEIVESLTTQEKLELEEYNKGLIIDKGDENAADMPLSEERQETIEQLVEQSDELNKKIELFTQERQEVMEKMNKLNIENESLHKTLSELNNQCSTLQNNIELLTNEKSELNSLNEELSRQIEDLKRERIEIMKESIEIAKPASVDEAVEAAALEIQHDDKSTSDKGNSRTKSVKQLTKEILKLKNTIKEREAEIGDCQMKILSLEEQHQKHNELIQSIATYEIKLKYLTDENYQLKEELVSAHSDKQSAQQLLQLQMAHESLQIEKQSLHQEYASALSSRDARIHELESLLLEYEKQIHNYSNTLQQKDKDIAEYINQVTKLNDVSQKLKSTIELLEEEKAKDHNAELVKTLNKQITTNQKKLCESEEKIKMLEEEVAHLHSLRSSLENKNHNLENELKKLQELYAEKQSLIKELQTQRNKHSDEMSNIILQLKERDEEIHEIKLQLRKESIENEKLRHNLTENDNSTVEITREMEKIKGNLIEVTACKDELNEHNATLEAKNKELLEKLKKFAASVKKKTTMYNELEIQLNNTRKELASKNEQLEQLFIQVDTLPNLQEKLKHAEQELNRLHSQKVALEQHNSLDVQKYQDEIKILLEDINRLNLSLSEAQTQMTLINDENVSLKSHMDSLNNKIADFEIEQKNSTNFVTKISGLETEINKKELQLTELFNKLDSQEQQLSQIQFGHDAKVQERDLYIESLEMEINKYKNRIGRLEESISLMEDRRHSLERKADQLGSQLLEKQKAYSEYTNQEDQLVGRLAVLMDHDRVVEKQLHEIENENKELQNKIQHFNEENQRLKKYFSDIQDHCNTLVEKASKADKAEIEIEKYQSQIHDFETQLKKLTQEHQVLLAQKKRDIEEIESEFHTQIENAIKEKKVLSAKYEKIMERVSQLESTIREYRTDNETLKINIQELTRINHELTESSTKEQVQIPDYTEQYVTEINKLNALVKAKTQEISELNIQIKNQQCTNALQFGELDSKVKDLTIQLQISAKEIETLIQETNLLRENNKQLQNIICQKEEQIKDLMNKKKLSFEMNIPKTEGLVISSTIEALNAIPKDFDVSSLESQMVSDTPLYSENKRSQINETPIKISEQLQKHTVGQIQVTSLVAEPVIEAKTAYLCYKGEENIPYPPGDPFNSDEGWGLGESEEVVQITPELSHLNSQIQQLEKENWRLKTDLDLSSNKLLKALKKLKEFKANNDMLSNELKISKQISQSSFLDSAIEDEMKINIQDLEKKIDELTADLNKEKREKEALKKQNEVFNNANERLTEMKEKMDNELELWKYKFKEVNDKISSFQWGGEPKNYPEHKIQSNIPEERDSALQKEIVKLEKENEELQTIVDQLNIQNNELLSQNAHLNQELCEFIKKTENIQQSSEHLDSLKVNLLELQKTNAELVDNKNVLDKKYTDMEIYLNNIKAKYEQIYAENAEIKKASDEIQQTCVVSNSKYEEKIQSLEISNNELQSKLDVLSTELDNTRTQLLWQQEQQHIHSSQSLDTLQLSEKYSAIEDQCSQLKRDLEGANTKIQQFEADKHFVQSNEYEQQINELNEKIQNLNTENDQLLSTVAELRSSLSSAVDQRGYEIAELWKHHLAQRELDFQNNEQELRAQLSASEAKYEQLLDTVQSSSQEETNQLIVIEQLSSLQNKLQDKEEHLRNLQDVYAEKMNQIDILRSEMEDEKLMYENKLLGQQEEYEKQIKELSEKNLQHAEGYEQAYSNLKAQLATTKSLNDELTIQIQELQKSLEECQEKVIELQNQLHMKESEIYQKTHDYNITLAQRNEEFENVRKQLLEYEKRIEDLTYEKESELAVLRLKMHEKQEDHDNAQKEADSEKISLTEALNQKIVECTNLNKQISDLNRKLEEYSKSETEMQAALETQELEIITLKEEITSLHDIGKISSSKTAKHVTFASDTKPASDDKQSQLTLNKELLDAVPRAELDLALYMLHQRDVRCEELTMELTQLLEERDTLQLRLSDCLRLYEELKSKVPATTPLGSSSSQEVVCSTTDKEQLFVGTHQVQPSSRSSSISDPELQAKLSELRSVKHSRDVKLRHDSEQRQMDLRLLQRDVANMPLEAVEQLAQAHHTLSRDSQSTSTVLLNWLRGKSTPKVVHM